MRNTVESISSFKAPPIQVEYLTLPLLALALVLLILVLLSLRRNAASLLAAERALTSLRDEVESLRTRLTASILFSKPAALERRLEEMSKRLDGIQEALRALAARREAPPARERLPERPVAPQPAPRPGPRVAAPEEVRCIFDRARGLVVSGEYDAKTVAYITQALKAISMLEEAGRRLSGLHVRLGDKVINVYPLDDRLWCIIESSDVVVLPERVRKAVIEGLRPRGPEGVGR